MHGYRDSCAEPYLRAGGKVGRGHLLDKHLGELGRTARVSPESPVADLLRIHSDNDAEPLIVTVSLNVEADDGAPLQPADLGAAHLFMILSWGVQRGVNRAIVDYRIGGYVTLVANVVNVSAQYVAVAPAQLLRVSASVTYGSRPGNAHELTFTDAALSIDAATVAAPRMIPAFATRVAWISPGATPDATLFFRTNGNATSALVAQVSPAAFEFVTIPGGARAIGVQNDAAEPEDYRLLYEIGL